MIISLKVNGKSTHKYPACRVGIRIAGFYIESGIFGKCDQILYRCIYSDIAGVYFIGEAAGECISQF